MNREGVLYVLDKLGLPATLPHSANVQISCPLAPVRKAHLRGTDSRPSMGISIRDDDDSLVNCFTCKWRSTLQGLVEEMYRCGMVEEDVALHVVGFIAQVQEVPLEELVASVQGYDVRREAMEDEVFAEELLEPWKGKTHKYMMDVRKLELDTIKAWEGGFDRPQLRATFPVRNWRGQLVGVVGRAVHEAVKPTYLNYWKFAKGRFLFGEHKVVRGTTLVVVEGPLDTLSVWQHLAKCLALPRYSVVGVFGSDATAMQVRKLVGMSEDVLLFLDNDAAGWDGATRLGKSLENQVLVRQVRYPSPVGGDPDGLVRDGVSLVPLFENAPLFTRSRE